MPLFPTPRMQAGGILVSEYYNERGDRHTIRLHIAPFDPVPTGSPLDYVYTHVPPKSTVTETTVGQTARAVADLWKPYYDSTWWIKPCKEVWYNSGGTMTLLPFSPAVPLVQGVWTGTTQSTLKRQFEFTSTRFTQVCRIYLMQIYGDVVAESVQLTTTEGGFDDRDVAWAAYVCGPDGAVVGTNGAPLESPGRVTSWWAHSLMEIPGTGGGGGNDIIFAETQPVAPEQNTIWVDTSSGTPPYPIQAYDVFAHQWFDIGGIGNVVSA